MSRRCARSPRPSPRRAAAAHAARCTNDSCLNSRAATVNASQAPASTRRSSMPRLSNSSSTPFLVSVGLASTNWANKRHPARWTPKLAGKTCKQKGTNSQTSAFASRSTAFVPARASSRSVSKPASRRGPLLEAAEATPAEASAASSATAVPAPRPPRFGVCCLVLSSRCNFSARASTTASAQLTLRSFFRPSCLPPPSSQQIAPAGPPRPTPLHSAVAARQTAAAPEGSSIGSSSVLTKSSQAPRCTR
mmetsp:Transcript_50041/g.161973  ORF Transcript_50041/g.161973 Transcript_50041/m.161973 type:complete len:249 (+) Transcript_50041:777-1523(+)